VVIRRGFRVLGAVAATGLLAAGCASADGSAAPGSLEKTNLTIAAVPAADSAGVYIAQQDGLFAAQGLHVKIEPAISSATVIAQQMAGKFDITSGNYVSYIEADAVDHDDMRVLAAGSIVQPHGQNLMIAAGSPIRTVAELKGKRIALNVTGGIGSLLVDALLQGSRISPSQVHFVPINFPEMAAALKAHEIDAAFMPEPFATNAEESTGAQPVADLDQGSVQSLPISGYIATQTWLRKYPKTAAAFRRALIAAQRIADSDPQAVEEAMVAYSGVTKAAAAVMAAPAFPLNTDPVLIQRVADLMQQYGLLSKPYDVKQMLS
jgi:NitT/TauT family transport system substrate-binding protein